MLNEFKRYKHFNLIVFEQFFMLKLKYERKSSAWGPPDSLGVNFYPIETQPNVITGKSLCCAK